MMMIWDERSHIVDLGDDGGSDFLSFHHLGVELGAFLGVLQDCGYLDGTSPVAVVEALGEDEFLEMSFFEFAFL